MTEEIQSSPNTSPKAEKEPPVFMSDEQFESMIMEDVKALSGEVRNYQLLFAQQLERSDGKLSQKELETWEDLVGDQLTIIQQKINSNNFTLEQEADAKQPMIAYHKEEDLHKTVEAQAANFYPERASALKKAISESDDPDREADLKYLEGYYTSVIKHLDFKYMTGEEVRDYGYEAYERQRTYFHNQTIRHLNGLNNLARKYQTRPFTVRNFWTSDIRDKEEQTPAVSQIMRYDRDIVEEYYGIAFSSEVQKRVYHQQRQNRMGFY
ncbi:hypothetical protein IKF33_03160 [Candidatus Saccharibacteria bacterium]|nr:hypothetical protein [Candidatus Saccharibacteria bacterium]